MIEPFVEEQVRKVVLDTSQDDRHAAATEVVCQGIGAPRRPGQHADADQVSSHVQRNWIDALVDQLILDVRLIGRERREGGQGEGRLPH